MNITAVFEREPASPELVIFYLRAQDFIDHFGTYVHPYRPVTLYNNSKLFLDSDLQIFPICLQ